jgi:predicted acyltransferase
MLLIFAELLRSCAVAAALPGSTLWAIICEQQTHASWVGASLHDLIQPSFYLLVGIGLFFSLRRRLSSGDRPGAIAGHVVVRSAVLIVLGMVLVSSHPRQWQWWFDDTLTQIGLAYPFLFLIARRPTRDWGLALGAVLGA